jgi:hypothetical protein
LLADQHDLGARSTFAEHGLSTAFPEITGATIGGRLSQPRQCRAAWNGGFTQAFSA